MAVVNALAASVALVAVEAGKAGSRTSAVTEPAPVAIAAEPILAVTLVEADGLTVPASPSPIEGLVPPVSLDGRPLVALTFDDGPDPRWTPAVLQILAEEGVVATFCTVGSAALSHPALIQAEAAQGHVPCDHTMGHDTGLAHRPLPVVMAEIHGQADNLRAILGSDPLLYRSPGGSMSPAVADVAHRRGMRVLHWTVDPSDYRGGPPERILAEVMTQVRPGSVILMHDGGGDRSATVAMLRPLIHQLKALGYVFTVP